MGPNAPNAADALDGGTGVPWQNPVEVLVSDGKFVTATLRPGESTQELLVRDFDFALLKDVNIVGIVVNIRRAASYTGVTDLSVRLAVGNNRSRSNRAVPNVRWPIFASNVEYGRPDDLWGEQGWVPAEVNDKSFGVAITARAEDNDGGAEGGVSGDPDSGTLAAQIDHVGITVFYEICR